MKKNFFCFIIGIIFGTYSCDDSENVTSVSTNSITTTNNETAKGDTSEKKSLEEKLATLAVRTATNAIDTWKIRDSIRDSKEPHIWVYQIGDSYDNDELAAKAFDRLKETENDIYVFRKKRKEYYLIKDIGQSEKQILNDSLKIIQKRINSRIELVDLSKECRYKPTNTDPIKYKIAGEKKFADCKRCE